MYEFHCDYIKNKYVANSKLLLIDIDSLMCEIQLKICLKILAKMRKLLILVIVQLSQNIIIIETN